MNRIIRILKIMLCSLAVYYLLGMQVEELFWLICGVMACTCYVLERKEQHREETLQQRIVFGIVSCYIALCLTLGRCFYDQAPYGIVQWIIMVTGLFILFHEGMEYLYAVCDRISMSRFVDKAGFMRGGGVENHSHWASALCRLDSHASCQLSGNLNV